MPPAPTDDGSIDNAAGLLRRVHPNQVVNDANLGGKRLSSAAFKDPQLSVDAEPILVANGRDWRFSLGGYSGYSLVRFKAQHAREKGLGVASDPLLPENPAHTIVMGKKTPSVADHLRDKSEWVHREP